MVFLGIILMILGALLAVGALFTARGTIEFLGFDMAAQTLFLIGLASGAAILWGFALLKFGTKRGLQQRKERKRIDTLSEQLEESERRRMTDGN